MKMRGFSCIVLGMKSLSVIVPVYNEENTVADVLKRLVKVAPVKQVIVVDDGSTDGTAKQVKSVKSSKIEFYQKENGGKGSAVRFGLEKAKHEYTLIQDADLEYDPDDIPGLLVPIEKRGVSVVYGSRFLGPHLNLLFWHRLGNSLLNFLTNILYNTTLSDMETCYKLIPTEMFKELKIRSNAFDMEPEITCKLLNRNVKIYEVPITYVGRDHSEGKKITWRDGIDAVRVIVALRLFRL